MCWMVAIPMAIAAASSAMGAMQQNQAAAGEADQMRRQKIEMLKQANYQDANLKLEDRQNYEDTVAQLSENNMQNVRNMSTVRQAIGESGMSGNSIDRIARITQGDMLRENMGLNDKYQRDYATIFGKRVANAENTNSQIAAMKEPDFTSMAGVLKKPSTLFGMGLSAASAYASSSAKGGLNDNTPASKAPISAAVGTKTGHN